MNQAIQFPDREWWDESAGAVCFPALVNGFQMVCAVSGESLISRYGSDQTVLEFFHQHRWDLEEEAEEAIKAEREDAQGWVWLS
ncbi:DUF1488 domain-containing protein [Erwinia sp. BNK-24-b]|uniref:DUF1488 domain-containing protein n=1 Tax=Erwinia TaxID=551 RepID=UPI001FEE3582|nr:DUF1488 domain-containing protein [Erwinia phyllosphaerae]MBV4368245.1 DUF1488 domain-containing protein [Erwinia phyllosphaerae]